MLTRLLLAGALGLTLATVSLDARAQGFGGFGLIGIDILLFDIAAFEFFIGNDRAGQLIYNDAVALKNSISEFRFF
jgi:hypothetical protein